MNFNVTPVKSSGFGQNEKEPARFIRMTAFWQDKANACLTPIGYFLAVLMPDGRRIADALVAGETVTVDSVTTPAGKVLAIDPPQVIALSTVADKTAGWGCPACSSAHGSGVYPSQDIVASGLVKNKFFYNEVTKRIHAISATCMSKYALKLGANLTGVPVKVAKGTKPGPSTVPAVA